MTEKNIRFAGVPDEYDPDKITSNVQEALDQVTSFLEEPVQFPPAVSAVQRYPGFQNVRRLGILTSTGTYGSVTDPRVARVVEMGGVGLTEDGQAQRFRFENGMQLYPLMKFPFRADTWALFNIPPLTLNFGAGLTRLTYGAIVPRIRHGLNRVPERVVMRGSAGMQGPTGQLCTSQSIDATYIPIGANLRCDIDFLPVFGLAADDIEWRLKHLLTFGSGLFSSDAGGGNQPGGSSFENPTVLRQIAMDLVTTKEHFGGLLLATHWGLGTFQGGGDLAAPAGPPFPFVGNENPIGWLQNGVNGLDDSMTQFSLPELGKDLFGVPVTNAALATYLTKDQRLILSRGTVDFVLE